MEVAENVQVFEYVMNNVHKWTTKDYDDINRFIAVTRTEDITFDKLYFFMRTNDIPILSNDSFLSNIANAFLIITTGLSYFEGGDNEWSQHRPIAANIMTNIVDELARNGHVNVDIHHFDREKSVQHFKNVAYSKTGVPITIHESFHDRYIEFDDLVKLQDHQNHIVVDFAHVLNYYKPLLGYYETHSKPTIKYDGRDENLVINALYPGFPGDIDDKNFILNFKYFDIVDEKIVTYIAKCIEKRIVFRFFARNARGDRNMDTIINCDTPMDVPVYIYLESLSTNYSYEFCDMLMW
jgi:hypothetical protein